MHRVKKKSLGTEYANPDQVNWLYEEFKKKRFDID